MRSLLTIASLGLIFYLALRRGGGPERIVAVIFASSLVLEVSRHLLIGPISFRVFDPTLFVIETCALVGLVIIALRANRWWPLCVSAFQVLVVFTHLAKLFGLNGIAGVYWAMTTFPYYVQYLILLAGIYSHSRRVSTLGRYPDWRTG